MQRRKFIQKTSLAAGGILLAKGLLARSRPGGKIYGHNGMQYTLDTTWSHCDPNQFPVNDCHEMVQDKAGRILLLTNETRNNVLIYNTRGQLLQAWGQDFPGAHVRTPAN